MPASLGRRLKAAAGSMHAPGGRQGRHQQKINRSSLCLPGDRVHLADGVPAVGGPHAAGGVRKAAHAARATGWGWAESRRQLHAGCGAVLLAAAPAVGSALPPSLTGTAAPGGRGGWWAAQTRRPWPHRPPAAAAAAPPAPSLAGEVGRHGTRARGSTGRERERRGGARCGAGTSGTQGRAGQLRSPSGRVRSMVRRRRHERWISWPPGPWRTANEQAGGRGGAVGVTRRAVRLAGRSLLDALNSAPVSRAQCAMRAGLSATAASRCRERPSGDSKALTQCMACRDKEKAHRRPCVNLHSQSCTTGLHTPEACKQCCA